MKNTISSEMILFYKFIFPAVWMGIFGLGTLTMLKGDDPARWMFLVLLIFGTIFIGWNCFPLKHVVIDGPDLILSNFVRSVRVPLSEIHDVTENRLINIHPVRIHFYRPTAFGPTITFMPTIRFFAGFSPHPIVSELKERADPKRAQHLPPPIPREPR